MGQRGKREKSRGTGARPRPSTWAGHTTQSRTGWMPTKSAGQNPRLPRDSHMGCIEFGVQVVFWFAMFSLEGSSTRRPKLASLASPLPKELDRCGALALPAVWCGGRLDSKPTAENGGVRSAQGCCLGDSSPPEFLDFFGKTVSVANRKFGLVYFAVRSRFRGYIVHDRLTCPLNRVSQCHGCHVEQKQVMFFWCGDVCKDKSLGSTAPPLPKGNEGSFPGPFWRRMGTTPYCGDQWGLMLNPHSRKCGRNYWQAASKSSVLSVLQVEYH